MAWSVGSLFSKAGHAIKKVGHFGSQAVKIVGDVGNSIAGAYNSINSITGGALHKTLSTVPGVGTALTAGGQALKFYNKHVDPRRVAIEHAIDKLGDRVAGAHQHLSTSKGPWAHYTRP